MWKNSFSCCVAAVQPGRRRYETVCLTGVKIKIENNWSLSQKTPTSLRGLWRVSSQNPLIWRPKVSQGRLRQIASLLCKFVQAINSISLGVPIWQQQWLESRAARRLSLGTEMRAELQWSLTLRAIVASLCSCPLFPSAFFHLPVSYILSFMRCGKKVWLLPTKPKDSCVGR